jgi:hypothetical protein
MCKIKIKTHSKNEVGNCYEKEIRNYPYQINRSLIKSVAYNILYFFKGFFIKLIKIGKYHLNLSAYLYLWN